MSGPASGEMEPDGDAGNEELKPQIPRAKFAGFRRAGIRRTLTLTAAALAIWSFGYGPLLPWSPLRPGYAALHSRRVSIVYPTGTSLPEALRNPDALVEEAETFHRLAAARPITVVLLPDWPAAYRVLPRLARRGIGAITLATGRTIYLMPTISERGLDPVEFVRHELSHAVIHQNQTVFGAMKIVEVPWLAEGLAVWFGNQRAYITDEEFFRLAPRRDVEAYIDPDLRGRLDGPFDIRFGYVCWRHFNVFLAGRHGEAYWRFVHAVARRPEMWRESFQEHFSQTLPQAVRAFAERLQTDRALPPALAPPTSGRRTPRSR